MGIEQNVGTVDRSIRGAVAVVLAALALVKARKGRKAVLAASLLNTTQSARHNERTRWLSPQSGVLLGLAAFLGGTAVAGHCPVYSFAEFETTPYRTPVLKMGTCAGGGAGCEGCSCDKVA